MTILELAQYRGIQKEIAAIKNRISDLYDLKGYISDGQPTGSSISKPVEETVIQIEKLKSKYNERLRLLTAAEAEILQFVDSVTDEELKAYITERFINGKSEKQIAAEYHCDRTTMYKRLKRYLKKNNNPCD